MTRSYLAFDIEIVKPLPDGVKDWKAFRPLGISCAATLTQEGDLKVWHGKTNEKEIADQLNPTELSELVDYLLAGVASGHTVLTWNGLGFDFDILAEESGRFADCRQLALDQVDMMFHLFCLKGFALGLDTAAKGMGLPGKTPGMSGDMAPKLWAQGHRQLVLDYVAQDVRTTLDLALATEKERGLHWVSRRGLPQYVPLPGGWLTVRQALKLPLPDTSWLKNPWPRSKFTGWLDANQR